MAEPSPCPCCKAQWVLFELLEPIEDPDAQCVCQKDNPGDTTPANPSKMKASVIDYWQGNDPREPKDEKSPAAGYQDFYVYNFPASRSGGSGSQHCGFRGLKGDRGLACYDDSANVYRIVNLDSANVRRFQLTSRLERSSSATADVLVGKANEWEVAGEITVHDSLGLFANCPGCYGLARYWPDSGQWEVFYLWDEDLRSCCSSSSNSSGSYSQSQSSGSGSQSGSGSGSGSQSGSGSGGSGSGGSDGGSDKSTAIVPASWSATGYTALFIAECPEVRFDDVMVAVIAQKNVCLPIDSRFLEVCEPNSVQVCGCVADLPVLVGAAVDGGTVRLRFAEETPDQNVHLVIRLTGIRKGFHGHRFPDRTRRQFEANEQFIRSAYPDE